MLPGIRLQGFSRHSKRTSVVPVSEQRREILWERLAPESFPAAHESNLQAGAPTARLYIPDLLTAGMQPWLRLTSRNMCLEFRNRILRPEKEPPQEQARPAGWRQRR